MKKSALKFELLAVFVLSYATVLYAHDFWIEGGGFDFSLVFGHGDSRMEFDPTKVKTLKAFGIAGVELAVIKEIKENALTIKTKERPSVLFVEVDNGYWSKTIYGWRNQPKRKASRVVESNRSLFYTKSILVWSDLAQRPLTESRLDIILLDDPFKMKPGDILPLKVVYDGKPVAATTLEGKSHEKLAETDGNGFASIKLTKELMMISVSYKEKLNNDPDADYLNLTSTLTFKFAK
ncbi:MAG: DUF4198 domain-containing protein [Nitrospirae bacterium]|nr:DUF4198 domain-containing protein [Nitrospirota bacterium]